jgi:hypothetical protein
MPIFHFMSSFFSNIPRPLDAIDAHEPRFLAKASRRHSDETLRALIHDTIGLVSSKASQATISINVRSPVHPPDST